jgi:hypothetical protein
MRTESPEKRIVAFLALIVELSHLPFPVRASVHGAMPVEHFVFPRPMPLSLSGPDQRAEAPDRSWKP